MYKNCNVVMLSTNEKASNIVKILKDTISYTTTENISGGTYQHLYITSDEEIKEGDYVYVACSEINVYEIRQITEYYNGQVLFSDKSQIDMDYCKKIIATTDTSLISINEQYFGVNKSRKSAVLEQKTLPQPSKQFMQKYIEEYNKGNVISEVDVEYDLWDKFTDVNDPNNHMTTTKKELKVNPDNTINIKPIKDNWSREEVKQLCKLAFKYHCDNSRTTSLPDKWIEENL